MSSGQLSLQELSTLVKNLESNIANYKDCKTLSSEKSVAAAGKLLKQLGAYFQETNRSWKRHEVNILAMHAKCVLSELIGPEIQFVEPLKLLLCKTAIAYFSCLNAHPDRKLTKTLLRTHFAAFKNIQKDLQEISNTLPGKPAAKDHAVVTEMPERISELKKLTNSYFRKNILYINKLAFSEFVIQTTSPIYSATISLSNGKKVSAQFREDIALALISSTEYEAITPSLSNLKQIIQRCPSKKQVSLEEVFRKILPDDDKSKYTVTPQTNYFYEYCMGRYEPIVGSLEESWRKLSEELSLVQKGLKSIEDDDLEVVYKKKHSIQKNAHNLKLKVKDPKLKSRLEKLESQLKTSTINMLMTRDMW